MNTLSRINALAISNPAALVEHAEKKYDDELNELVDKINKNKDYKIVLIAGPSGSGKTTTAKILKSKLINSGKKAEIISLDHFFLPMDKMPVQENGEKDFESVFSLDIEEIHRCFSELIKFGKTMIPSFSFNTFTKTGEELVDISDGGILIVEGLHALNNLLTDKLSASSLFKIYVSVNRSVTDDNGNKLLSSRQIRLIRRISRDSVYRNTDALETLKLWTSVVRGEEKYLYCFKDTADIKLFTFHSYEPCLFKNIIIKLLKDLPSDADNYDYIMKAKESLEMFEAIETNLIPENSLISEFI